MIFTRSQSTGTHSLQTSSMPSNEPPVDTLPTERVTPFRFRAANVQNPSEISVQSIMAASFRSFTPCPSKTCAGNVSDAGGNLGTCDKCPKKVNMLLRKKQIEGEIDVNDELSLTVDIDCIDATFGNGVSNTYSNKPSDLADKFLGMVNVVVMYDNKSKKTIIVQQE